MNPIDALFQKLRSQGRKAFIPFITAGDPDLSATRQLVQELSRRGASLIEIGFPYSDPIADGPVIQRASERALAHGVGLHDVLDMAAAFRNIRQVRKTPWYEQDSEVRLFTQALWASLMAYMLSACFASTEYNLYPYFMVGYTCAMLRITRQPLPDKKRDGKSILRKTSWDRFPRPETALTR